MHHVKGDKESEAHQDAASPDQPLSWFARYFQSREIAQLHTAELERVIGSLALRGFVVSREDPLHGLFPSCLVLDLQAKRRIHWVVGTLKNLIVANKEVRNKFCQSDGSVGIQIERLIHLQNDLSPGTTFRCGNQFQPVEFAGRAIAGLVEAQSAI